MGRRRKYTPSEAYELLPKLREQLAKIEEFISGMDTAVGKYKSRKKFPVPWDPNNREIAESEALQTKLVEMRAKARIQQKKIERDIAKAEKAIAAYEARVQAETKAEAEKAAIQATKQLESKGYEIGFIDTTFSPTAKGGWQSFARSSFKAWPSGAQGGGEYILVIIFLDVDGRFQTKMEPYYEYKAAPAVVIADVAEVDVIAVAPIVKQIEQKLETMYRPVPSADRQRFNKLMGVIHGNLYDLGEMVAEFSAAGYGDRLSDLQFEIGKLAGHIFDTIEPMAKERF